MVFDCNCNAFDGRGWDFSTPHWKWSDWGEKSFATAKLSVLMRESIPGKWFGHEANSQ
jgi:hypothetical protein